MSALQALVNQTQAATAKKASAKPAATEKAAKAPKASKPAAEKVAKPETAPVEKAAKAPKAEKPATLRTVHVLQYMGEDGKPASTSYTRFSRMVKDMRARLDNGETCEIARKKAPVESVIVDEE